MPAVIYYGKASNRLNMGACREQIGDGVTLATRNSVEFNCRRIDGKFTLNRPYNELIGLVEDSFYGEHVAYIKNTSGGSWAAGLLLNSSTTLTAAGSCTAPNVSAGANVTITLGAITGTIEAGSLCKFTDADSPNPVQYALCTAVGSGTDRTFNEIPYSMTTPAVKVIPAIAAAAATNASAGEAKWVVTDTIANNGYAFVYGAAYVTGLDTSAYSAVGSKVYLSTAGASTPTIPTTVTSTGQCVGQVQVKSATVGEIKYFPKERMIEKVANGGLQTDALTSAHIFVGSSGNVAADVAMSGEATISNTGAVTLGAIVPRTVTRTNTQTVTDSTTLTADNTLTFNATSGRKYAVKLVYLVTTISTSGVKVDLGGGTATASTVAGYCMVISALTSGVQGPISSLTTTAASTGTYYAVVIEAVITCSGTGTIKPRFAQNAETGASESVIVATGSYLTYSDVA